MHPQCETGANFFCPQRPSMMWTTHWRLPKVRRTFIIFSSFLKSDMKLSCRVETTPRASALINLTYPYFPHGQNPCISVPEARTKAQGSSLILQRPWCLPLGWLLPSNPALQTGSGMFWYAKAIVILGVFNFLMFVFSALSGVFRTALRVG